MSAVIAVIDYGMGNLHSVAKALEHVAPACTRARHAAPPTSWRPTASSSRVRGAIGPACRRARPARPGRNRARHAARETLLGILPRAAGADVTWRTNGWHRPPSTVHAGDVHRFPEGLRDARSLRLKIPHMGWSCVQQIRHALWAGIGTAPASISCTASTSPSRSGPGRQRTEYSIRFATAWPAPTCSPCSSIPESAAAGLQLLANRRLGPRPDGLTTSTARLAPRGQGPRPCC